MIVFDQLKKEDPQLRAVTLIVLAGLLVLLAGLWWVQVVSARDYQESLETQSFRTVRIPAVRGSILDCNRNVLAENRPNYSVSLYLEELRKPFDAAYFQELARAKAVRAREQAQLQQQLGRPLNKQERKTFGLSAADRNLARVAARSEVASNVVIQVSQRLQQPVNFRAADFERHYEARLALPYPIVENLDSTNIARFEEQSTSPLGVDLDVQSTRVYPYGTSAAHLLGCLRHDDSSIEGEEAFFSYRLPDFRGDLGLEYGFDKELHGNAGAKSVLVNNMGYRQTERVWTPAEAGHNLVLTLDLHIQQVAENALREVRGPATRGAVVVMDVRTGDILAMVSSPTFNPNDFIGNISYEEMDRMNALHAQKNRATQENYAPGSIFKTVVGLAMLEAGLNPSETYRVQPNPELPSRGAIYVGRRRIKDTAPPGDYDFRRALIRSSNSYFITNGLRFGVDRIVRLGQRFHLGEKIGLPLLQETAGAFPRELGAGWTDGKSANLCIGQDPVLVSPMQVAVLTSALANGGKVLWPRLVDRIEPHDPSTGEPAVVFASGRVRDEIGVSQRSLKVLRDAMLADTEDAVEGSGRHAAVEGLRICGKTGTAQIQDERNVNTGHTTWFASFAPYENPKWAVVVMVEDGASGGETCSPVAKPIYTALLGRDRVKKGETMAKAY